MDIGIWGGVIGALVGVVGLLGAVIGIGRKVAEIEQLRKDEEKNGKHVDEIFTRLDHLGERVARLEGKCRATHGADRGSEEPEDSGYIPPTSSPIDDIK